MTNALFVVEVLIMGCSFGGAIWSLVGLRLALHIDAVNIEDGFPLSTIMPGKWRVTRERKRLIKQLVILLSSVIVCYWMSGHDVGPYRLVYVTRSLLTLFLSVDFIIDTFNDNLARQRINAAIRAEVTRDHALKMVVDESRRAILEHTNQVAQTLEEVSKELALSKEELRHLRNEANAAYKEANHVNIKIEQLNEVAVAKMEQQAGKLEKIDQTADQHTLQLDKITEAVVDKK